VAPELRSGRAPPRAAASRCAARRRTAPRPALPRFGLLPPAAAHEAKTIEESEPRGALAYLMRSPDMHRFWAKVRATRVEIVGGDAGEDFFTTLVDEAYDEAPPP